MKRQIILTFITFLVSTHLAFAAEFAKITIPGAKCGNGADYAIYVKPGNSEKLLIEFQGGGACWDYNSCFVTPLTSLAPLATPPSSVLTSEDADNPYLGSTMIYVPYCTGDVHIGKHIAQYKDKTVYHYGQFNFDLSFKYLKKQKVVDFKAFKDVTVWGASAGAIGALLHGKDIEPLLRPSAHKTLIPDSVGLHFGPTFWDKFSRETKHDFEDALARINIYPNFKDGFIAKKLRPTLELYYGWQVAFLIATKDKTMSTIFGNITPEEHRELVLGPEGLPALALDYSHVHIWLQESSTHTFLVSKKTSETVSIEGLKAIDFVRNLKN
jgi:Pectinacetylesterase